MHKKKLLIFSDSYPNGNSETFLHNEMFYLAPEFEEIIIFPQHNPGNMRTDLPANVKVVQPDFSEHTEVRKIITRHFFSIVRIFLYEIIHSPHRFKYIRNFRLHLIKLVITIRDAEHMRPILDKYRPGEAVFYSYWFNEWGSRLSLYKFLFRKDLKFLVRIHGYDFDENQREDGYHLFRAFDLSQADKVISISEYGKKYTNKRYKGYGNKLEVSRLGVSGTNLNPVQDVNDKELILVSCSSVIPVKRMHLIPDIIKHINIPIRWIHFGDGELLNMVKKQVKALPDFIKVEFKGYTDNQTILNFYENNPIDLFINVSELEGIPVTIMEAINFGIPVMGCNTCGMPEIVTEHTGILLEKDFNSTEVATLITSIIAGKLRNKNFREEVKEFWNKNFNAEINYPLFIRDQLNQCVA